jgi:amidase
VTEIHELSAEHQAARIRAGELSPVEVAEHYLARIDRLNERLGAFITVTPELALEQARAAEQRVRSEPGEALPPLLGVPVPIKDLDMVAGVRWTWGSKVYAEQTAVVDEDYVAGLRRAGAVFLGKTNTPEFGFPCYTENDIAPPARTPWDPARSAGGSSGGAGAAVAAGLAPVAQGSDGGGSIRIPASVCGLFGLKPTRGRVTAAPVRPDLIGLSVTGPLSRTVADAATLLDVMAGNRPGDYFTPPPPTQSFRASAGQEPGRLRIARFATAPLPGVEVDSEVQSAWESTSALLKELGHDVEDIEMPFDPALLGAFSTAWAVMSTRYPVAPDDEGRLRPLSRWLRERGAATSAAEYLDATTALQQAVRAALAKTDAYDAVLTPTLSAPPMPLGYFDSDGDPEAEFLRMTAFTPFAAMYNISGQPAVTLPLDWSTEGLPIGSMLAGRMGEEATLLSLSAQIEQARPWAEKYPPIWGE